MSVVIPIVPLIFKTPVVPCVNPPVPDNAVVAVIVPVLVKTPGLVTVSNVALVRVPLFVYVPVIVKAGIDVVPLKVFNVPLKVCVPLFAVRLPLVVKFPAKVTVAAAASYHDAPELMITFPVNALVPVADEIVNVPLVPPPTVVIPVTVNANPAASKVVPSPIFKSPPIVRPTTVAVDAVPLKVRVPVIDVVPTCKVLTPEPERVRWLYVPVNTVCAEPL